MTVSIDPHVERCLQAIRSESAAIAHVLLQVSPEAWTGPTNCPPWRVRTLAAHIVASGEGAADSIRQGLAGSVEPTAPPEVRQRRQAELEASGSGGVAQALAQLTTEFISLYDGLTSEQLESICYHRRGNRSARWYAAHRLAEVAFHGWDLRYSLGADPVFDETIASLLLPTLIESNAPRTYAAGLSAQPGAGETYLLSVSDDPGAHWLVQIDPDDLTIVHDDRTADLSITSSAANIALLVYGRADLSTLATNGAAHVEGDLALIERFAEIFPRP